MRRIHVVVAAVSLVLSISSIDSPASTGEYRTHLKPAPNTGAPAALRAKGTPLERSSANTTLIASFDFDDGVGGPDSQGWVASEVWGEESPLFHVDDFVGVGGSYQPLAGNQSLWCGIPFDPATCPLDETYPGYGNFWLQFFESVPFAVTGDVSVDFLVRYDTESTYDFVHVDYLTKTGAWEAAASFDGMGETLASVTVPADSLDGSVKLRFRFESDGIFSDEDGDFDSEGAVIIDSVTVSDSGGVVDFQDFESELSGDLQTADGDWTAAIYEPFGIYAGVFDGTTVLQEDSLITNNTHFWGFFDGSIDDYSCGGHPEQIVVPECGSGAGGVWSQNHRDYIQNRVSSPAITIDGDALLAAGMQIRVEADVYTDLSEDNAVYYDSNARFLVGGCWTEWQKDLFVHAWGGKEWVLHQEEFVIPAGATQVQVSFNVHDMCWAWCDGFSTPCHSHGPLFDNVAVSAVSDGSIIVGAGDVPGSSRWELHQNVPNPFNPATTISYDVPAGGGNVSLVVYDVAGRLVRTLVSGAQGEGLQQVGWDGRDSQGQAMSSGVYFYRMTAGTQVETRKMLLLK